MDTETFRSGQAEIKAGYTEDVRKFDIYRYSRSPPAH